jgi:hypothetical protein
MNLRNGIAAACVDTIIVDTNQEIGNYIYDTSEPRLNRYEGSESSTGEFISLMLSCIRQKGAGPPTLAT